MYTDLTTASDLQSSSRAGIDYSLYSRPIDLRTGPLSCRRPSLQARRFDHWRNFTLKTGGDQRRRQDLVSGGHDDQGAKGAEWVQYVEGCPLPSRGPGVSVVSSPSGVRAEPRPLSHFLHILGHRTLPVARKKRFSPPLSKVVVASHHRHIQGCAYADFQRTFHANAVRVSTSLPGARFTKYLTTYRKFIVRSIYDSDLKSAKFF